jgi:hypothetical protein
MEFVLRKTGFCEWSIYSKEGRWIYTLPRVESPTTAMDDASAWITSWPGSIIRMEDEQDKQTD